MLSTIAAISTAVSSAGIGIIRISGPDAMNVIDRIYRSKGGKKRIKEMQSHTIHYGYIYDEETLIDEVLVMIMKAPKTFTGEDTVEIDCHGGIYTCKKVLETVLKHGARTASPGEFTKRAFLNGRLDLSQAEAVMDVIQAKNDYALKSSMEQLKGSVKKSIVEIRRKILYHIAYIESALDDPEHICLDGYPDELMEVVKQVQTDIDKLISSADDGKIIQEGIKTVILGKPNAGKSSLLNVLVGSEKAIVTDIAGTTRDILEEYINLNGLTLKLIDTAGIRDTEDAVEKIGVDRAIHIAREADLILYVADSSRALDEDDYNILEILKGKKAIILYNKTDLEPVLPRIELARISDHPVIPVSAKEETGLKDLEESIRNMFFEGELSFNDEVYITNMRHKEALMEARESLNQVINSIDRMMPEDFFSIDLMNAYESLGRIIGESVGEDLVNEIFSKFCTGK
ncbi:MAG: tRNA uridine-5-carboxymethylaminomethyl(34) synthesis GTPase MnmE [Blautia sp.]|nr:tRNA uridine-5-carboxymethylaminomethyl(34) synthesis GTPase MnmE [Blautia sp.]